MNLKIPPAIRHATRLVRGGSLVEATRLIQRTLRGGDAPPEGEARRSDAATVEGTFHVVDGKSRAAESRFITRSYSNTAGTREYKVYIPAVHSGQALPLVVMLHGCMQGPDDFAAGTRMNMLAEEHGFIVAYPEQSSGANNSNCWNWFQAKHQQRDRGEPSLIAGITREVAAAFGTDARRVYIAGLSAGGAMAAVMATTYPDIYASVGIHSGLPHGAALDLPSAFAAMRGERPQRRQRKVRESTSTRRVPVIVFHGDNDTTVHPRNGDELIAQASRTKAHSNAPEADAALERSEERDRARGRDYTRITYRDAAGKVVVEQWLVHGAAHAWFGGSAEGSFSDPTGPDASREMLRFFRQHESG
ncbi:MAG: extracellular catalytic domain type 1 short-chain-length polyhydroxyalkanoate depolymerase [Burkholderiales bacterium]